MPRLSFGAQSMTHEHLKISRLERSVTAFQNDSQIYAWVEHYAAPPPLNWLVIP